MKNIILNILFSMLLLSITSVLAQEVQIQFLANEGVLIKTENTEILVDAIFDKKFDYLDVLPESQLQKFEKAEAPFHNVDLILSTHLHGDHFNPRLVGSHLKYNPKALFLSTNEAVNVLKEKFEDFKSISSRVNSETPDFSESKIVTLRDTEIKILRFVHPGESPWKEAENVAYLITIEGKKILHLGDSMITIESLKAYNLDKENIDVVILPYWLLGPNQKENIIENYINPKQLLVVHIPLNGKSKAKDNLSSLGYTKAIALTEQFKIFVIE